MARLVDVAPNRDISSAGHSRPDPSLSVSPAAASTTPQNDKTSGLALRESLLRGSLSAEAQHALMTTSELRKGLFSSPIPDDIRKAVGAPAVSPNNTSTCMTRSSPFNTSDNRAAASGTEIVEPQPVKHAMERTIITDRSHFPGFDWNGRISRAPFKAISPINSIPIQRATQEPEPVGNITGILRATSVESQTLKRKRDDDLESSEPWKSPNHSPESPRPTATSTNRTPANQQVLSQSSSSRVGSLFSTASKAFNATFPRFASSSPVIPTPPTATKTSPLPVDSKEPGPNDAKGSGTTLTPWTQLVQDTLAPRASKPGTSLAAADTEMSDIYHGTEIPDDSEDEDYHVGDIGESVGDDDQEEAPPVSRGLYTAENGRPYTVWRQAGNEIATSGALLPTAYQPLTSTHPNNPWVCPIRTCRRTFPKIASLGAHFIKLHRRENFNDNCDGTFSVVGGRNRFGFSPAAIVSKNPLGPKEQPMPEPSLPDLLHQSSRASNRAVPPPHSAMAQPAQTFSRVEDEDSQTSRGLSAEASRITSLANWKTIQPLLKNTPFSPMPMKGYVPELLPLPRRRDIKFNPQALHPYAERLPQDISALLMQLTGVEPPEPCVRCQHGKGPFQGCIVMSTEAPTLARQMVTSCANCFYKGNQTYCNLNKWTRTTYPELFGVGSKQSSPLSGLESAKCGGPPQETSSEFIAGPEPSKRQSLRKMGNSESGEEYISVFGYIPNQESSSASTSSDNAVSHTTPDDVEPKAQTLRLANGRQLRTKNRAGLRRSTDCSDNVPSGVNTAQPDATQDLPLEEWEEAPGRIRNDSSGRIENVAFSTSYLTHSEPVGVAPNVRFNVLVVRPGNSHHFEASHGKLRSCSVAAGKVQVKMPGQQFNLGMNGLFIIKSGTSCMVKNRFYGDAALHVTEISEVTTL
ncbi:uncharacterized protein BCR38DRAFT_430652 [Pseudomassariella vexata]|uniref:C2H2-type domain-containing protein n=1 Tax=Pseudomassariella vexata TaxID=1141098 RepID=A0A1Y2E548_9PEZI|nr:uncharacterized protein BCR38DRAFT_430652 [Pseudomassariella vexata]ORY66567.1 hypothetical protein BCR38DRAFT_430652 [Pseudomassariella vexata]